MSDKIKTSILYLLLFILVFLSGVLATALTEHLLKVPLVNAVREEFNALRIVQDVEINGQVFKGVCVFPQSLIYREDVKRRLIHIRMMTCDKGVLDWSIDYPKDLSVFKDNPIDTDQVMRF